MMAQIIDRKRLKADVREMLRSAQVSPKGMTALYLLISMALSLTGSFAGDAAGILGVFISVLSNLIDMVLGAGFVMYCMAVRRSERAEYLTLFDGFSFVGKIIGLNLVIYLFIVLWSMLFVIPGIVAGYRYRFALYNLYENPGIGIMEALDMSKRQTVGYKGQLLLLDLSYVGWVILASLPLVVIEGMAAVEYAGSIAGGGAAAVYGAVSLPWTWSLLIDVWSLAVALFYLPNYQCTELGYFETAKQTSGVGLGSGPRLDGGWGGQSPDGLGGL